jgi:hypothetical protein
MDLQLVCARPPGSSAPSGRSTRVAPPEVTLTAGTCSAGNELVSVIVASRLAAAAIPVRPWRPQRPLGPQADNGRIRDGTIVSTTGDGLLGPPTTAI